MRGETGHDLSGYVKNAGATAAALDRNREQLKSLITDFNTTAAAFARQDANLSAADRRAAAHAARLDAGARRAQRVVPAAARARAASCARASRAPRPTLDVVDAVRAAAARPRLRARAARPGRRPAARRCPTSPRCRPQRPAVPRGPPRGELPERASSTRGRWTRCRTSSSRPRARSTRRRPSRCPASPARAARPTPTARGSACSPPAARTSSRFAPGVFGTTPEPLLGANPPKPHEAPAAQRRRRRARRRRRRTCARNPGGPPPQRQVNTNSPAFQARYAQARGKAVNWLRKQLKVEGLDKLLDVATQDADAAARSTRSRRRASDDRDPQAREGVHSPCSA